MTASYRGRWFEKARPISGWAYVLIGVLLFGLKYNLDRLCISLLFDDRWTLLHYLNPFRNQANPVPEDMMLRYSVLILTALPFIAVGLWLTARRLKTIDWPPARVGFFFVPVLNLVFFLVIALTREHEQFREPEDPHAGWRRFVPRSKLGSAAATLVATALIGLGFSLLGTMMFKSYGWGLFGGVPFCLGVFAPIIYGIPMRRSFSECFIVSLLCMVLLAALILLLAIEGLICIVMAMPIWLLCALIGCIPGYFIQAARWDCQATPAVMILLLVFTPLWMGAEYAEQSEAPLIEVTTSVTIAAPPEVVWDNVITFPPLPPPEAWLFKTGVSYPKQARIEGSGVGAIRYCEFSTGAFVEPIEIWDAPRLLKFAVISSPPPMVEWSPYRHVHPPHLDGYFKSEQGQFLLEALPGGGTRLHGTTWYRNRMWPHAYWKIWSDEIVHGIHGQVLEHIKRNAENE